ncbi:MAG TPA: LysE family transporter [Verrucomicrobiae bacterium]|jgi:threonine/homoserine/homoserine lactone efflux protein|nr:LysE family transporter [Verrucomicrobiae bacterium]
MFDQHPLILAALTGFISGFLLSVPVGPVNVTIINEGARSGLRWGLLIGAGATVMELLYCALAFTGFASFFDGRGMKVALELVSFAFMLYLGIRFLRTSSIPAMSRVEERFKSKLHPHSAFGTGFVRVMLNPGVFLFWIVLAAHFRTRDWVPATRKGVITCVAGVGLGVGLWFAGLSYAVSRGHRKFTQGTLLKMEHGSGIAMLLLALAEGIRLVFQVVHHKL